ncbi:MAG: xanthomonadin biosynthesis protein, partial [Dokdonella sp.]
GPAVINAALATLFFSTLARDHTPLIARAIIAMEGQERLALPRVADYARALTRAWALLFALQSALLLGIGVARHGAFGLAASPLAIGYLHFGGYLLPALFMLGEFTFRRRYLHHIPHDSLRGFMQRLVRNWPRLLREHIDPADAVIKR